MGTLGMTRVGKTLSNSAPLHGEIVVVVEGSHLIDAPAEGTVVEDDACLVALPCSIRSVIDVLLLSASYAKETDDIVVSRLHCKIAQGDARRRSSLSEDGDVICYLEISFQSNDASHIEDDDSFTRLDSLSERTSSAVVEVGNVNYFTASTTGNISAMTLCAWEGWSLSKRGCVISP